MFAYNNNLSVILCKQSIYPKLNLRELCLSGTCLFLKTMQSYDLF